MRRAIVSVCLMVLFAFPALACETVRDNKTLDEWFGEADAVVIARFVSQAEVIKQENMSSGGEVMIAVKETLKGSVDSHVEVPTYYGACHYGLSNTFIQSDGKQDVLLFLKDAAHQSDGRMTAGKVHGSPELVVVDGQITYKGKTVDIEEYAAKAE